MLQAEHISKQFGGVHALQDAHLAVRPGEVHALMGENGAGKSTLAKIIAGAVKADRGTISIDGDIVPIANPLDAQRHGVGIIHQELDLFPHLTVGENMVIGNLNFQEGHTVRFRRIEQFCGPWLRLVGLEDGSNAMLSDLSISHRQLVAIARALSMNARYILMDEPTSSLFGDAAERLFQVIADLKNRGVAIVYVSHKMDEIFRLCDRITVQRDGRTIGTRETSGSSPAEIIQLMVGRELQASVRPERQPGETLLTVSHLVTGKLKDISFTLQRGEVLGVAGLVGSGRSELGEALAGRERIHSGEIQCSGHRIGLVPEDRKEQGLMMQMSVLENSTLAVLGRMQTAGFIHDAGEREALAPLARELALKCASLDAPVGSLSGGNQQKALLARWLLVNPEILFLDDPARGIDVGAKQDIYRIIDGLAASGKGVILVSSELPELLRCCDRILVLREGRLAGSFTAQEATQENIMAAAT